MKKTLLIFVSLLFCAITFAQNVPQGMNYQAVARDAGGAELSNQALTIKLSLLVGSSTGTVSWQETHSVTTNNFGLFSVIIGEGTSTGSGSSATFSAVNWGSSSHFVKVELDAGSGLVDMGTTKLMSVPYALSTAGVTPTDITDNAAAIATETAARISGDSTNAAETAQVQTNLNTEAGTRATADSSIQADVNQNELDSDAADSTNAAETAQVQTNLNTEAGTRATADNNIQADVNQNELDSDAADSTNAAETAQVQTNLNTEAATRASADNLKANIASPTFTGTVTIPTGASITAPTITGAGAIEGVFTGNLTGNVTGNVTGDVTGNVTGSSGSTLGNAGTVTTNANLTGPVTSTGNATAIANGAITNDMLANGAVANLSGTNSGDQTNITGNAGTVTTNANLTGPVTSTGNATDIANGAITNAMLANGAVANLSGTNSGDQTNITGSAATVTEAAQPAITSVGTLTDLTVTNTINGSVTGNAGTVTTNANLTGPVTSTGNATDIANGAITNAMLANAAVATLSGTNSGDQTNITGSAATVTAAAQPAITSVGTLSDLTVTNTINGSVTGNAGTVTTNANLTGDVTSSGSNATTIANDAVTSAKILDATIVAADIDINAITNVKILDANVTTSKIADGNITTSKILDANVTTAKLANDAVTGDKILDGTIATADIANGAITTAKLAGSINAATATVLETARTIGGVSFNGSANINLPGVNEAGTQNTSGNAATATKIASITNTDIVQLTETQTLTNKTLSSPTITGAGAIAGVFTGNLTGNVTGNVTGSAATVTTNANLTGVVTSTGNATAIADAALSIAKTNGLQAALDLKAPLASPTFTGTVTIPTGASITAPTGLVKGDVGLGNVDNTSDVNKPVSTAGQAALDLKAPLASPTFTGALTANGTTALNDNVTVANSKTLTVGTGATSLGGTLAVTGATTLAGTLGVSGAVTLPAATTIGALSPTEIVYLSNVTSDVQTQINSNQSLSLSNAANIAGFSSANFASPTFTGTANATNLTVSGTLTGTLSGNATTSSSTSGNAATATALAAPRAINGVNFDGTADITVTAAAETLSGSALNQAITGSSLTSVGTLANLTVTNAIAGDVTGNAATVTTNANLTGVVTSTGNATAIADAALTIAKTNGLQGALDLKAPLASPTFTGTVTIPSGASITAPTGLVKGDVGLGSVNNTSDVNKPVSTAGQAALDLKAPLASPTFTGTVAIPSYADLSGTILSHANLLSGLATKPLSGITNTTIASATATGVQGSIAYDASYVYICIATNSWIRIVRAASW
jgi:hypothetical protein